MDSWSALLDSICTESTFSPKRSCFVAIRGFADLSVNLQFCSTLHHIYVLLDLSAIHKKDENGLYHFSNVLWESMLTFNERIEQYVKAIIPLSLSNISFKMRSYCRETVSLLRQLDFLGSLGFSYFKMQRPENVGV